jgi:hypothetical protein
VRTPQSLSRSCCTTLAAVRFWAIVFVVVYGVGLLLRSAWPAIEPFGDTIILVALGAACVINFRRNRTLHCGLTGPLFVAAAVAAALIEGGVWRVDVVIVWGVVLFAVGLALFIEWRSVGRHRVSGL